MQVETGTAASMTFSDPSEILTLPVDEVLRQFDTTENGLTPEEAQRRRQIFGWNTIAKQKQHSKIVEFLFYFKNPVIIILIVAAIVSGSLGDVTDMCIIFAIVMMSVFLNFNQEFRAGKAAEDLQKRILITTTSIRDGAKQEVPLSDFVPGDIILLAAGEIVPADARVIIAKDLFAQQSALTGESIPIEKQAGPITPEETSSISSWTNYLFMGSSIRSGTGSAVIVRTGEGTEYGKILKRAMEKKPDTEFDRGLKKFSFFLLRVTSLVVGTVFIVNTLVHPTFARIVEYLLFSITLAIGLTPELLPMIVALNLSKAAVNMARKKVIVKRLTSIQNFGSMDVLCTDKTGTLTENRIEMVLHVDITGHDNDKVFHYSYLNCFFQTGLKSPLDEAILSFKDKGHVPIEEYEKDDEIPFDFQRKRVSVIVRHEGQLDILMKGAYEEVERICDTFELDGVVQPLNLAVRQTIEATYEDLSTQGFLVLGVAYKEDVIDRGNFDIRDERGLTFLGFVAFLDPPKASSEQAIKDLRARGVAIKILTGDNELVTKKICKDLDIPVTGVVLGSDVATLGVEELARVVETANIFAKVTPSQKEKIILALRHNDHVVGFLGDGINDTPPMKAADVSISVENAVDVAKETADIILLEASLLVLAEGVLEGRKTFGNTEKYMAYAVSSNFGTMFSAAGGSLFVPFIPMLPAQVLLNNLLNDIAQVPLPVDNVDEEYITQPKRLNISYIGRFMIAFGPLSSIFDVTIFIVMFFLFSPVNPDGSLNNLNVSMFQTAFFVETLTCQLLIIFAIRTRHVPFWRAKPSKYLVLSVFLILVLTLVIPAIPPIGGIFGFVPLPLPVYGIVAACWGAYFTLVELMKRVFFRHYGY